MLRLEKARGPSAAAIERERGTEMKGGGKVGPEIQYWEISSTDPTKSNLYIFAAAKLVIFDENVTKKIYLPTKFKPPNLDGSGSAYIF